jgi:Ser/Thr protein kinase RdoA (MazF antagonist)
VTDPRLDIARARWGFGDAPMRLVAMRENHVYRVDLPEGPVALRLHRPELRTRAELVSELQWMTALATGGLTVPLPVTARDGALCAEAAGSLIDVVSWLDGEAMGRDGVLAELADAEAAFAVLGGEMARLHDVSDRWTLPEGFHRPHWDVDGLVGETPLWGRFWDCAFLDDAQAALLRAAREAARERLSAIAGTADYGLIHADLVPENVLTGGNTVRLIDFDDGGFGFRLFDLATSANRADRADPSGSLRRALIDGYLARRAIDLTDLPLFQALRAFTYVGWISDRTDDRARRAAPTA